MTLLDNSDKLGKAISLVFALTAVLILIGVGVALSHQITWLAITLAFVSVITVGMGFILKALLKRG